MRSILSLMAVISLQLLIATVAGAQNEQRFVGRLTFKDVKVTALAMTTDSKHILWGFSSGSLSTLAPKPGKIVTIEGFPGHSKAVTCANYSPDNRLLATGGGDGTVKIWETYVIAKFQEECQNRTDGAAKPPYPQAKKSFTANTAAVTALAYSPDGKRIATCSPDGRVKVWHADTTKLVFTIAAHKGSANAVAYSPDGELIATAGADKTAKLWRASSVSKQPVFTLSGHDGPVTSVAFSTDGKYLAAGSGVPKKSGEVVVWDVEGGKQEFKITDFIDDVITTVCFHPTMPRLATGARDKKIRVFSTDTKKLLYVDEHVDPLIRVMITGDGSRLGSICAEEAKSWLGSPKVGE
jgi:WD40 repeat protein